MHWEPLHYLWNLCTTDISLTSVQKLIPAQFSCQCHFGLWIHCSSRDNVYINRAASRAEIGSSGRSRFVPARDPKWPFRWIKIIRDESWICKKMSGNYHITSWTENSDWSSGYLLDPDDDSLMRPWKNVSVAKLFSEVGPTDQHSIFKADVMQLLTSFALI